VAPGDGGVVGRESDGVSGAGGRSPGAARPFDSFAELHLEISEVRDLGDRVLANGWMRGRGTESGVEIESPWAYLLEFKNGKAIWVPAFLDPREALEAAGLLE
jgi:ketosteroid isomerase-like protein